MQIVRDDLWLCDDCLMLAVNGDASGCESEERAAACTLALEAFGFGLVPAFDSETGKGIEEFSRRACDCCGCRLHGSRHEFAVLGE